MSKKPDPKMDADIAEMLAAGVADLAHDHGDDDDLIHAAIKRKIPFRLRDKEEPRFWLLNDIPAQPAAFYWEDYPYEELQFRGWYDREQDCGNYRHGLFFCDQHDHYVKVFANLVLMVLKGDSMPSPDFMSDLERRALELRGPLTDAIAEKCGAFCATDAQNTGVLAPNNAELSDSEKAAQSA